MMNTSIMLSVTVKSLRMARTRRIHSLLIIAGIIIGCRGMSNDILGLDIPEEPNLDANTVCKTFPGLKPSQYELCSKYPDVAAAAIQGLQMAIHECQYQFRTHRWNCSSLETKNKNPHSSPLLGRGFRETAFAYAVSAAGMAAQISRACSMGKIPVCGCVPHLNRETNQWKWDGCEANIDFANHFAKKFLDSKEDRAKDLHSQINVHNNRVGRNSVRSNTRTICKCHGMSGSCELKTCWKTAPPFREVSEVLKKKYHHARKVDNTNSAGGRLRLRRRKRRISVDTMVFFEKSPNYCDASLHSEGTRGRYCNRTSDGIDNCELLCCGRGYNTLRVTRTERCNCRFHWCCYVVCQSCTVTELVTVCK